MLEISHYGHVYGGGAVDGVKGGQAVVGSGRLRLVWDADGGLGGRTYIGGKGDGRDGDGDGLNQWEDTVENAILGTDPNAPLDSSLGLKLHHPIISMLDENGGRLDIEREIHHVVLVDLVVIGPHPQE